MRWHRGRARRELRPKQVAVKLRLPFLGELSGTWEPVQAERRAAWELYIELITRVTVVELRPGEGLVREALRSLYSIFASTREILRKYGPEVAPRGREDAVTFGVLAVAVLNGALRPLLAKWHPALAAWEAQRPDTVDQVQHERDWDQLPELRRELSSTRAALADLARVLADVAGAAYLLPDTPPDEASSGGGFPCRSSVAVGARSARYRGRRVGVEHRVAIEFRGRRQPSRSMMVTLAVPPPSQIVCRP